MEWYLNGYHLCCASVNVLRLLFFAVGYLCSCCSHCLPCLVDLTLSLPFAPLYFCFIRNVIVRLQMCANTIQIPQYNCNTLNDIRNWTDRSPVDTYRTSPYLPVLLIKITCSQSPLFVHCSEFTHFIFTRISIFPHPSIHLHYCTVVSDERSFDFRW